jgi:hypothetical protein
VIVNNDESNLPLDFATTDREDGRPAPTIGSYVCMYVCSIMAMHPMGMSRYYALAKYILPLCLLQFNSDHRVKGVAGAGRPSSLLVVAMCHLLPTPDADRSNAGYVFPKYSLCTLFIATRLLRYTANTTYKRRNSKRRTMWG